MDKQILLSGYDAKRCARRIHNEWDPTIEKTEWEVPAEVQMRFDTGIAFEADVFGQITASTATSNYADLRLTRGKAACIAATVAAMEDQIDLILGGWLPDDEAGGRTGRPDLLLHVGDGRYVPGDVKAHKMVGRRAKRTLTYSTLDELAQTESVAGLAVETTARFDDYLQLAHYWRMLEAAGRAPGRAPTGFIIGTDTLADLSANGRVAAWLDLNAPLFETYSRSSGTAKRSALERYDHEQGFRLKVAHAAAEGEPAIVQPIFIDECNSCPWIDYCHELAGDDAASRQITSGRLSVREWNALASAGVVDINDLGDLDVSNSDFQASYLPEVTHIKDAIGRLSTAIRRARMTRNGETIRRVTSGPIAVPRADVEIDFDIEWDPSDHVYLWGALVIYPGRPPAYHPIVSFDELDDDSAVGLADQFANWLRKEIANANAADLSLLVYHYAHPEPTYLKRLLGEPQVTDLLAHFVDLLPIVREHFFGLHGLGIKKVAPAFGFNWRDEDPGGLQSQLWLIEARATEDEVTRLAGRRRILDYNEDDVRATYAIRSAL